MALLQAAEVKRLRKALTVLVPDLADSSPDDADNARRHVSRQPPYPTDAEIADSQSNAKAHFAGR